MTTSGLYNLKAGDATLADLDTTTSPSAITVTTLTVNTSIVPDASGGANIGSATLEMGDIFIADNKFIKFGSDQDVTITYDETTADTLVIAGGSVTINDDLKLYFGTGKDAHIEYDEDGGDTMIISGAVTFADGATDVDIASHDTTNGLKLGGTLVSATAAELNILDGVTATAAELNSAADLSAQGGLVKVKKITISTTPTGSEQDTTWDLPVKSVVMDVIVDVTTAEATGATKTLDVGLLTGESGGDPDGFLDGVDVSSTGLKRGKFAQTTGSNNNYVGAASTHTLGELLTDLLIAGEDTAAGGDGIAVRGNHLNNGTAVSVTYTAGSADWAEFRGDVYITYMEIG